MFNSFNKTAISFETPPMTYPYSSELSLRDRLANVAIAKSSPLNGPKAAVIIRRVCMCGILGLDSSTSVLSILSLAGHSNIIPRIILSIIHLCFSAWCLIGVVQVVGERRFLLKTVTRRHFDIFLGACSSWNIVFMFGYFSGMMDITASVWWCLGLLELLAMWFMGWLAWSGPFENQGQWSQV